ncbi:unnamed protein product [Urochloa humidicola]
MATARKAAAWALVALALVATDLGSVSARAPLGGKPQREFDYFALSLQWPGTICGSTRYCCSRNGCCRSEPLQWFTIHGLWPDYDDGTWPSCCRHTEFELDKILPLKETLDKYWPSLYCSSPSTCFSGKGLFWAHEEMLSNGGIQISNGKEYALSDVIDTIKHAFGGAPQIVCKKGSVEELRLCFDKELKPRDCLTTTLTNGNVSRTKHCPRYITLPTYDPLVLANSTGKIMTQFDDFEVSAALCTA